MNQSTDGGVERWTWVYSRRKGGSVHVAKATRSKICASFQIRRFRGDDARGLRHWITRTVPISTGDFRGVNADLVVPFEAFEAQSYPEWGSCMLGWRVFEFITKTCNRSVRVSSSSKKVVWIVAAIAIVLWQLSLAQVALAQEAVAPPVPPSQNSASAESGKSNASPASNEHSVDDQRDEHAGGAKDAEVEKTKISKYVRIKRDNAGDPAALQTATVRFTGKPGTAYEGQTVDLVGVIHIGQSEYYSAIKKQLSDYDTVLYELVAPDGTRIRPEDLQNRRSILASMQTGMKDILKLEYQLEKIDYMAENFRHADMSPDEFVKDLERRGDSVWKMAARMMGAGMATQTQGGDVGLIMAFFSNDRAKMMKRAMASQLLDIELVTAGMNDAGGENTLIKGRNRKAFEILKQELDSGAATVAVFYGAGHLSDMAERLETEFEMEPTQTTWLDAWDLTKN